MSTKGLNANMFLRFEPQRVPKEFHKSLILKVDLAPVIVPSTSHSFVGVPKSSYKSQKASQGDQAQQGN